MSRLQLALNVADLDASIGDPVFVTVPAAKSTRC